MESGANGGACENLGAAVTSDASWPELGLFLRAARPLRCGELVLREAAPLLRVPGGMGRRPLPEAIARSAPRLKEAGLFLPEGPSPVLQQLRRDAPRDEPEEALLVRAVVHFNSFAAGVGGRDQVVFATLARANHSCAPNCIADGDEGTLRLIRDVEEGDMLTISYLDDASLLLPRERRLKELSERWDFACRCQRCASSQDDARRFRGCQTAGCQGELVVECGQGGGRPAALSCNACGTALSAERARSLFEAEALASAQLAKAMSGDLEEEEEGEQLMRCYKFAAKHPAHGVALELAHAFGFPDPVPAKRGLLAGLARILGDAPCQLVVDVNRELADLLGARGELPAARACAQAAAEVAAILDGRGDAAEIAEEWERRRPGRPRPQTGPSAAHAGLEVDLDMGERGGSTASKAAKVVPTVAAAPSESSSQSTSQRRACGASWPWLAMPVVAAIAAAALVRWRQRRG